MSNRGREGRSTLAALRAEGGLFAGLTASSAGLALSITPFGVVSLGLGAVVVGAGVGLVTPLGFAMVADSSPEGRMGQTMGAAEMGREIGDAGGPLVVGLLGTLSLLFGLGVLAGGLAVAAGIIGVTATGSWRAPAATGISREGGGGG